DEQAKAAAILQTDEMGFLRRWLFLAGYRQDSAVAWLVTSSVLTLLVGAAISAGLFLSGVYSTMIVATTAVPGGVGDVFLPAVYAAPWLLLVMTAAVPALAVYQGRRRRVESVEQDLPLTLELLATLSEARSE